VCEDGGERLEGECARQLYDTSVTLARKGRKNRVKPTMVVEDGLKVPGSATKRLATCGLDSHNQYASQRLLSLETF